MSEENQEQYDRDLDFTSRNPTEAADLHIDAEFGTLEELTNARPAASIIFIPETGKRYHIRSLTGQEVDAYRTSITVGKGNNMMVNQRGMRAKLVVLALANPDGSRMLTDKDTALVQAFPSSILERLFDRARKFNGLTDEDTDDEKGNS